MSAPNTSLTQPPSSSPPTVPTTNKKRVFTPENPFADLDHPSKWSCLSAQTSPSSPSTPAISCPYCFTSVLDQLALTAHFEHKHQNRCATCKASFISARLLDLHIEETHDSYFKTVAKLAKSYKCLDPECSKLFWNDERRKLHLVAKHGFSPSFSFHPERSGASFRTRACKFFAASGQCRFGEKCHFRHDVSVDKEEEKDVGKGGGEVKSSGGKTEGVQDNDEVMKDIATRMNTVRLDLPEKVHFGHKRR